MSEVHLVESASRWTLTFTMTQNMLDALRSQESGSESNGASGTVVVHIEPNLVPGEPFEAFVAIKALPE